MTGKQVLNISVQRLIETGIIAIIVMYGTQRQVQTEMKYFKEQLKAVVTEVNQMKHDLYAPKVSRLKGD